MGVVRVKTGVEFSPIAPGGFEILSAISRTAKAMGDLTITSGTDGMHSGPDDPHYRGEAYDVRSHDFSPAVKQQILAVILKLLGEKFWGFLEDEGADGEHFHFQVKKDQSFP